MTLTRLKSLLAAAQPAPWQWVFNATNRKPSGIMARNSKHTDGYALHVREPPDEQAYIQFFDGTATMDLIVALRNQADALVAVAEAAEDAEANLHDDCGGCEKCNAIYRRLRTALAALTPMETP